MALCELKTSLSNFYLSHSRNLLQKPTVTMPQSLSYLNINERVMAGITSQMDSKRLRQRSKKAKGSLICMTIRLLQTMCESS
jgi:hypothetical protein